jgi:excisionase family DNA binding protein
MTAIESESARRKAAHSIPEVCAYTGLGRDGIYRAIRTGQLVARKYGKRTVILDHDLRAFLNALPEMEAAS